MMKPVRKIGMTYRSLSAIQPSGKNGTLVRAESALERDACCLLEFDPAVVEYVEQPLTIQYTEEGRSRRYTPDFFVRYAAGRPARLIEIKYAKDLQASQALFASRFLAAQQHAEAAGWQFRIWTEVEIQTPYLKNAKFLLRFRAPVLFAQPEHCFLLLELVARLERTTPAELLRVASDKPEKQAVLLPVLWHLVSTAQLGCDLSVALTTHSPIWSLHNPISFSHG
ncbi:TnsA endonuclease N-terminal domain-containing protein [Hymenobacter ruricola]|uniref:TnsA endonuclease N-terminal domain-containing protein n=1 Tax=Hymenobacter ruricola TaxID=2791023 RepID=A0ABS0IAA7_9BACT|nr:TnsA endonuclease N-terminal domain-containing protein [Hymenobacter ruricola]MBF9223875.1 TnsA endonuclease N-terminal domain-containing protein [Hymenobacter ruricola]